ncbi:MAG: restriction endonuclease subunit S, partial [Lachnospira sp.]|nr:restriction endonuclease subunit S [Lachnospira sp.]
YPDSVKQEKIVDILDRVSDVIEKRKAELSYLDTLIKARFVEMFGDPIINSKGLETKELNEVLVLKAGDFTAASDISVEPTEINIYPCYGGNGIRGYVAEYNQEGEYSLVGRQGALSGNVQYATGKFKNTEHALLVKPIIRMNSIWLNQLLLNLDLKRYQTGAAQPGLSVKNLQDIQIIMVPIDEQRQFAAFVNEIDKSKLQKFSAA